MPTLAELMAQSAMQSTASQGLDIAGNFAKGTQLGQEGAKIRQESAKQAAQIAQRAENHELEKQKHAAKLQELEMGKFEKLGGWIDTYAKMPEGPAKKAFGSNYIPNGIKALGLGDKIHPLNQEMLLKEPKLAGAMRAGIAEGKYTYAILADPEAVAKAAPDLLKDASAQEIAAVAANYPESLNEAQKEFLTRQTQKETNAATIAAAYGRQANDVANSGVVKVKEEVAKEFAKYDAIGGGATIDKAISTFEDVLKKLKNGEIVTGDGPLVKIPYTKRAEWLAVHNPKLKAVQDTVYSEQNLKALTGDSAPGERQIADAKGQMFDVALPTGSNIERVEAVVRRMKDEKSRKEARFRAEGFMPSAPAATPKAKGSSAPAASASGAKTYNIGGGARTADEARAFYKANPKFLTPALKKELGL